MDEILMFLQQHIEVVQKIGDKIENGETYIGELREYMPSLKQMITTIFELTQIPEISLSINTEFVIQVLNDIIYGMEQEDTVFLLDVLRYGLLEVYYFVASELQNGV